MQIIHALESTRDETLRHFTLGESELGLVYAPGKWSVRYLLHHLADAETVLLDRIRRVISEGHCVIWAFDQDAWAEGLDYANRPLDLSARLFGAARDSAIHLARIHYEHSGQRTFVHSETGLRTLRDEFEKIAAHNEQHLAQIRMAFGQGSTTS